MNGIGKNRRALFIGVCAVKRNTLTAASVAEFRLNGGLLKKGKSMTEIQKRIDAKCEQAKKDIDEKTYDHPMKARRNKIELIEVDGKKYFGFRGGRLNHSYSCFKNTTSRIRSYEKELYGELNFF